MNSNHGTEIKQVTSLKTAYDAISTANKITHQQKKILIKLYATLLENTESAIANDEKKLAGTTIEKKILKIMEEIKTAEHKVRQAENKKSDFIRSFCTFSFMNKSQDEFKNFLTNLIEPFGLKELDLIKKTKVGVGKFLIFTQNSKEIEKAKDSLTNYIFEKPSPMHENTEPKYEEISTLREKIFKYLAKKAEKYAALHDQWTSAEGADKEKIKAELTLLEKKIFAFSDLYDNTYNILAITNNFQNRLKQYEKLFSKHRKTKNLFEPKKSDSQKLYEECALLIETIKSNNGLWPSNYRGESK